MSKCSHSWIEPPIYALGKFFLTYRTFGLSYRRFRHLGGVGGDVWKCGSLFGPRRAKLFSYSYSLESVPSVVYSGFSADKFASFLLSPLKLRGVAVSLVAVASQAAFGGSGNKKLRLCPIPCTCPRGKRVGYQWRSLWNISLSNPRA